MVKTNAVFIYTLSCPDTGLVRYVGQSIRPKTRLYNHFYGLEKKTKKTSWIKSLLFNNKKPVLDIIDVVSGEVWKSAEKGYIRLFKSLGANLTNGTDGGDGASVSTSLRGVKRPYDVIKKISLSSKGHSVSEETRDKIRKALIGSKPSEATLLKYSEAHKKIWQSYSSEQKVARQRKTADKIKKPVLMISSDKCTEFDSAREAAAQTGLCFKKISAVCRGSRKSHGGYSWKFK